MKRASLSRDQVLELLEGIRYERAAVEGEIQALQRRDGDLGRREEVLQDLLSTFDSPDGPPIPVRTERGRVYQYVKERVVEILQGTEEPVHVNELHRQFLERGYEVPGAGKPVNISAHLTKLKKAGVVRSPRTGFYELAATRE